MGVVWDLIQWVVSFVEGVAALAVILVAGAMIAMAAFWVLARCLGRLASAPVEPDPDGCLEVEFSVVEEFPAPAEPRAPAA